MSDREIPTSGLLILAAILLGLLISLAGCAHAPPPAPVIDMEAPNLWERCKDKCAAVGKIADFACEDADLARCICQQIRA